jgi:hypothetical protein
VAVAVAGRANGRSVHWQTRPPSAHALELHAGPYMRRLLLLLLLLLLLSPSLCCARLRALDMCPGPVDAPSGFRELRRA